MKWGIEVEVEFFDNGGGIEEDDEPFAPANEAKRIFLQSIPEELLGKAFAVNDGSLRGGVEFIFGVFNYGEDVFPYIEDLLSKVDGMPYDSFRGRGERLFPCKSPFAGTHINIGTEGMSKDDILGLMCLWHIYESRFASLERKMNSFTPRIVEDLNFLISPSASYEMMRMYLRTVGEDRQASVMMFNLMNKGSRYKNIAYRGDRLEIRQFETSVPLVENMYTYRHMLHVLHSLRDIAMNYTLEDVLNLSGDLVDAIRSRIELEQNSEKEDHERVVAHILKSFYENIQDTIAVGKYVNE